MSGACDEQRVEELFATHSRALLLYARQWVGAGAADDVLQRVFVRLIAGRSLPQNPRPWLFRCVRNEAIGLSRAERRRSRREKVVAAEAGGWFVTGPDDPLDASAAQAALKTLPQEAREVVMLRLWSDLTLAEISLVTGQSISTAQRRYMAALQALREKLEPSCETPAPMG